MRVDRMSFSDLFRYKAKKKPEVKNGDVFGKRFYSYQYGSRCVVVKYKDDNNWWFVPDDRLEIIKSNIKFSDIFKR